MHTYLTITAFSSALSMTNGCLCVANHRIMTVYVIRYCQVPCLCCTFNIYKVEPPLPKIVLSESLILEFLSNLNYDMATVGYCDIIV